MMNIKITLATTVYEHTRDLVTGAVPIAGVEPIWLQLPPEEIFYRFLTHREWDVSEISFAKYCSLRASGDDSLTALPVFLSRMFRHSSFFVRADSPLRSPADLAGLKVGIPEWAQTAAVYARGLLADEYGVDLRSIDWVQAGVNQIGRREKVKLSLPDGIRYRAEPERTLNDLLLEGDLDAVIAGRPPLASEPADGRVIRLVRNFRDEEFDYYSRSRIFPIMHGVVVRTDLLREYPWLAMNLYKGFVEAKDRSVARMLDPGVSSAPVPWLRNFALGNLELMNGDLWPYGVDANRDTLEAFLRWAADQGVCRTHLDPEDLFAPTVDAGYKV